MKKLIFAGLAALAVLGMQQAGARADHGCHTGRCGGHGRHCGHHCVRAAHVPVEFPLPCLTVPLPKLKIWCACPPCSWGADSAWYNVWPGTPGGGGYYTAGATSGVPYYWNGR